jgi:predicted nuclease of restriction endonuclease-like RecB superfamily
MLRKEHLFYRVSGENIKPRFIDPQSPFLLESASELIGIYSAALETAMTREELENMTSSIIRSSADVKIASGLNKLLLDRCEFALSAQADYPQIRKNCFLQAAEMLKNGTFTGEELQKISTFQGVDIYGDLPDFEKLVSFAPITPTALLDRYNLAQAQGLLIYARKVVLKLNAPEQNELRKFLKAVKFFRLLAHIRQEKKAMIIELSGPYAIIDSSTKYALQLANLLPAAVNLANWELYAQLKMKEREVVMKLSHKSKLVSHYQKLAGYIPEEIRLFHRTFNDKQSDWQITGETPFIDGGNQELIFPDLSFVSAASGKILHLELFHRWHAGGIARRIELLKNDPQLPLILGIDRALVKSEEEFEELFADAPEIRKRCWLFRDFPGVSSCVNALNRAEKELAKSH